MSLENFQITPSLLCELYKDSLVVLDDRQILTDSLKSMDIAFLGGNEKNILVFVYDPGSLYLNEQDLQFLTKILTQCKFTLADVCIVNTANIQLTDFAEIADKFKPKYVLGFGMSKQTALQLPVLIKHYTPMDQNEITFLFAKELHELTNDKDEKKELWNCLKKIFSIQS